MNNNSGISPSSQNFSPINILLSKVFHISGIPNSLLMKMLFAVNKDSFTFSLSRYGEQLLTFQYRTEQVIKNKHTHKEKKLKKGTIVSKMKVSFI